MPEVKITDTVSVGDKLTVFAGPCVAESKEICFQIAEYMSDLCRKLDLQYVFKASFDKANRSSGDSFRGPGLDSGLELLNSIKRELDLPIVTDIHESCQAEAIAEVADVIQVPAFLCRQTDLLEACAATDKVVNIKKGQFMAPEDMRGAVEKVKSAGNDKVLLTERGSSFGYHNLVVDMRSLVTMRELGVPVVFDATHSVQLPGGLGNASGGRREFVMPLAKAAAAVGIDVLFLEVHPDPDNAKSDGPNSVDFSMVEDILRAVKKIHDISL